MKRISSLALLCFSFALSAQAATPFNRKYSDIQAELKAIVAANPATAQMVDIGVNDTGQMIQGIKTGTGPVHNLLVATHHGNEYGSTEVGLAMAHSLAEAPIAGQTITVIPVLNVSGYDKRQRYEIGIDPNRDYPGPCGSSAGPFSLKSTKALADYIAKENIVASTTLHTFSPFVLYPWGFGTDDVKTEYDQIYIDLGKASAIESGYPVGNSAEALYPANGCYEDYAMWKHGVWSMLYQLGFSHNPTQPAIDTLIAVNVPGLRRYYEQVPTARADHHAFNGKCTKDLVSLRIDE